MARRRGLIQAETQDDLEACSGRTITGLVTEKEVFYMIHRVK